MSVKIMGGVWDIELTPPQLIVLLAMADHSDHNGQNVFPSVGLIAWKTGYSDRQVRRVIKQLLKTELLIPHKRPGKATLYEIHLSKGKKKPAYNPGQDVIGQDVIGHSYVSSTPDASEPKVIHEPSLNHQEIRDSSAPKKSADNAPRKANPNEPLFNALVHAFGFLPSEMKGKGGKPYWVAAADLKTQGVDTEDIPGLYQYVKNRAENENWRGWTVMALPKYVPDWRKAGKPSNEEPFDMLRGLKFIVAGEK